MRFNSRFLFLTGFVFSVGCIAAQPADRPLVTSPSHVSSYFPSLSDLKHGHTVVQLGGYWGTQGEAQDISIRYLRGDHYTVNNTTSWNGLFGLGYYINGMDKPRYHLDYGVNAFYLANTRVSGQIIQEQLFTNLGYGYSSQHIPVYFGAKAIIKNQNKRYNITLDAGIGPNFMQVSHYHENPLNDFTIPDNGFSTRNQVTFSAMAGIGLRLNQVFDSAPLECGYRFFYLGQGQFNINNDQVLSALKTGNVFGNALLCSITI